MEHLAVKEVDVWNVVNDELEEDNFGKPWSGKIHFKFENSSLN